MILIILNRSLLTDLSLFSRLKYFYYGELCKLDPSYKDLRNLDTAQLQEMIKELRVYSLDVDLLKKLSNDFSWDFQQLLLSQIKVLINRQVLDFDIKTNVFGKDEVVVRSSVEDIKKACAPYLNFVTNIDMMASKLLSMISDFNSYFYELYLVVIDMLEQINRIPPQMIVWRNILIFLKLKMTTKRVNRIGQVR